MTKKIFTQILIICLLVCLAGCQSTYITNNNNESPTNHQQTSHKTTVYNTTKQTEISLSEQSSIENTITTSAKITITQPSAHTHKYSNATCTEPPKCSCGLSVGIALGHNYSSATCTAPQICTRCGAIKGNALGHSYSEATCTSSKICTRCGNTADDSLGHSYINNICSRCGAVDPDSLPTGLEELYLIDSQHYQYKNSIFTDSFGNKHNGVHFYNNLYDSGNGREAYSTFNLNGQYSKFSGSIVAADNTYAKGMYYVNIYVDNVLVYSKNGITRTSEKIDFSINVKGGQQLTIRVGHEQTVTSYNEQIGIVNAKLEK